MWGNGSDENLFLDYSSAEGSRSRTNRFFFSALPKQFSVRQIYDREIDYRRRKVSAQNSITAARVSIPRCGKFVKDSIIVSTIQRRRDSSTAG